MQTLIAQTQTQTDPTDLTLAPELDLGIEELDDMLAPGFTDFAAGFATGVALVGLGVAAAT